MNSQPIVCRAGFNAFLSALLVVMVFVTGCVPPKKKMPKGDDVTSAPAAVPVAIASSGGNPLSFTWQRLMALESKGGALGAIAISNAVAQDSEEVPSAVNTRLIEVSMDVTGQLRKPFVEAVMNLDASPARITGVDVLEAVEPTLGESATAAFSNKGNAGWRVRLTDGQALQVNQKLRFHVEARKGMQSIEIHIQRGFKKANGDTFNIIPQAQDGLEAQRLLESIEKELIRRTKGAGSNVFWLGVGDCSSIKGEEQNGQCYPTEFSWRLAEKRAAVLCNTPWQEKITLQVSGIAATPKKQENVTRPTDTPIAVEKAKPAQEARPTEAQKPVEETKPAEEAKPAEVAPAKKEAEPMVSKPEATVKPVESAKPEVSTSPATASKPAVAAKPVEASKPAVTAKPAPKKAAMPKVKQRPVKKPATKEDSKEPKANDKGQPIYDLSDVLGK